MTRVRIDRPLDPLAIPEFAEALFEHSRDGLLLVNAHDGRILQANRVAAQLFGLTREALAGGKLGEFLIFQSHDSPEATWDLMMSHPEGIQPMQIRGEDQALPRIIEISQAVAIDAAGFRALLVTLREQAVAIASVNEHLANERRFRKLIDNSADVITILNENGVIIYESPNGKGVVHWHDHRTLGDSPLRNVHPDDLPRVTTLLKHLQANPDVMVSNVQCRVRGNDSHYYWIEAHGRSLLNDPDIRGIVINWRDITPRKIAKEQLMRSEARLADAQRIGRIGNWEWYVATGDVWWSNELFELTGVDPHTDCDLYTGFMELVHPEDRALVERAVQAVVNYDMPFSLDHRLLRPDGQMIWLHGQAILERDEQGDPVCLRGISHDITDRKLAEEQLRRSETRLADAQRIARIGHWEWDAVRRKMWWSNELRTLLGFNSSDVDPSSELAIEITHVDDVAAVRQAYLHSFQSYQDLQCEYRVTRVDGGIIWIQTQGIWELDINGEPSLLRGISQDITARKLAEIERLQMLAKLQDMQRLESLGVLAGGIAHDFNNLMTPVLGFASLVRAELRENSLACDHLRHIETAAQRAAELCQQMLAYSGQGKTQVGLLNLRDIVQEMVSLARVSIPKGIVLDIALPDVVPNILADANQIRQVMLNLLLNAAEAHTYSEGTIAVRLHDQTLEPRAIPDLQIGREEPVGRYLGLEVQDTGSGMTKETIARIFEPFFTTKFTGRGLGLSALLGIVRGHHGLLELQSEVGRGSRFCVWLPVPLTQADDAKGAATLCKPWRSSGTVLVVDDEPVVRLVASKMLEQLGFATVEADNGLSAIELLAENAQQYVAVLLDHNMPQFNGRQTLQRLRQRGVKAPVVLMTGYHQSVGDQPDIANDLAGILTKPFTQQALANLLRSVVG